MIKVLQVIEDMGLNSGVSSMLLNYYKYMNHDKVNFDFITFKPVPEDVKEYCEKNDSIIYQVSELCGKNVINGTLKKEIEKIISEHKGEYDVIHGHEPNAAFIYFKAAKKYGIGCRILHSHNAKGADLAVKKFRNYILNNYGLLYANVRFACSKKAAKYLYHTSEVVCIINNAIDTSLFEFDENVRKETRKELGIEDKFVIGHVGRFAPQKNHEYLLEVFEKVYAKNKKSVLLLIGDGELFEDIKQKVRDKGFEENVIFTGITNNTSKYMQAMDLFAMPSRYEGLPVVCVEAQASGLDCVLSGEITREVKFTDNVGFVDIGKENIDKWVDVILKKEQSFNDKLNSEKRLLGAQNVKNAGYEISSQAKRLEKIYIRLAHRC